MKNAITALLISLSLFITPKATIHTTGNSNEQQGFFKTQNEKIYIDVDKQVLYLTTAYNSVISSYKISTGQNGTGENPGSYKTPRGIFEIHNKFGQNNDPMSKYKGRVYIGKYNPTYATHDNILSRILTLDGKETHNKNTLQRCVYIHGTSATQKLGKTPCSMGCIRMCPYEIIELFNKVKKGTSVYIHDSKNPLSWEKNSLVQVKENKNPIFNRKKIVKVTSRV